MRKRATTTLQQSVLSSMNNVILYGPFVLAVLAFIWCLGIEVTHTELSREFRDAFYSTFGTITYCLSIVLSACYGQKYGIGWIRAAIYSWLCFWLVFGVASVQWNNLDFAIFGSSSVASFRSLLLLPLLCWVLAFVEKRNVLTLCDYLTPYFLFRHGVVTCPCWLSGCCAGTSTTWGLVDPSSGVLRFPTQPCIILASLGIALWGLLRAKKRNYETYGEIFGVSMIAYGIFRYALEFFTDDIRVIGKWSLYSIYSLIMVLMGLAVLYLEKRIPKKYKQNVQENSSMEEKR